MAKFKTKLKGFVRGALLVPALGVAAHACMGGLSNNYYRFNWPTDEEYSLKYRFETAYSFNTPAEHKTYTTWDYIYRDGQREGHKTPYLASPYATYPAMVLCGLIGARRAARRKDCR